MCALLNALRWRPRNTSEDPVGNIAIVPHTSNSLSYFQMLQNFPFTQCYFRYFLKRQCCQERVCLCLRII